MNPQKNASYGALISIVLILVIIVIGAFYVWGERINQRALNSPLPQAATTTNVQY